MKGMRYKAYHKYKFWLGAMEVNRLIFGSNNSLVSVTANHIEFEPSELFLCSYCAFLDAFEGDVFPSEQVDFNLVSDVESYALINNGVTWLFSDGVSSIAITEEHKGCKVLHNKNQLGVDHFVGYVLNNEFSTTEVLDMLSQLLRTYMVDNFDSIIRDKPLLQKYVSSVINDLELSHTQISVVVSREVDALHLTLDIAGLCYKGLGAPPKSIFCKVSKKTTSTVNVYV